MLPDSNHVREVYRREYPACPDCGTMLALVDCEAGYPVLRGDQVKIVQIPQAWYCGVCMVGVEPFDVVHEIAKAERLERLNGKED